MKKMILIAVLSFVVLSACAPLDPVMIPSTTYSDPGEKQEKESECREAARNFGMDWYAVELPLPGSSSTIWACWVKENDQLINLWVP